MYCFLDSSIESVLGGSCHGGNVWRCFSPFAIGNVCDKLRSYHLQPNGQQEEVVRAKLHILSNCREDGDNMYHAVPKHTCVTNTSRNNVDVTLDTSILELCQIVYEIQQSIDGPAPI